jgi:RNA polymerase-binding protein DksA
MEQDPGKKFYSRPELEEFRMIIQQKLDDASAEYHRLSGQIREMSSGGADDFNFTEFGNDSQEKEQLDFLLVRQAKFIEKLRQALTRIENGTYGICRLTGELIPKDRLRVVPHATTTVDAKRNRSSSEPADS